MTSSDRYSPSGAAFVVKRALASAAAPAVFISVLAFLLIAVAACTDDDDGTPSATDTASPTSSLSATTSPSSTDNGGGDGNGNGNGQATPTPSGTLGAEESPPPDGTGSGTATIDGVQYDFSVSTCSIAPEIEPDLVRVIGFGTGPDGKPLIGTASWNKLDLITGVANTFDVVISVNASSLFSVGDQIFKMGTTVLGSAVDSLEIDLTGFSLTVSGMFVDLQAPEAPPVPGTFSVSCSRSSA